MNYYNDTDEYVAQWLRNLIDAELIPKGEVDERSIVAVRGSELRGYRQCHFFAGIGGWPLALRLAGWPEDRPVWTGSCPCQPFSAAGKQQGVGDERHLWPAFARLIGECKPAEVVGEQVASALGREWLAGVFADLETMGYAVAGADLCAAGVGAPHIRQRLFWVADADNVGSERGKAGGREKIGWSEHGGRMGDTKHAGLEGHTGHESDRDQPGRLGEDQGRPASEAGGDSGLAVADERGRQAANVSIRSARQDQAALIERGASPWSAAAWIPCADGKARRIEPGIEPLVNGVSNRVGRLRAYGNAIVPQVAAQFIKAWMECQK